MKSRWFLKLMVIALIISLLPVLIVSAADGPNRQPPARERTTAPQQRAQTGRVVVNEPAESITPDDDTPGSAIELQCGWSAYGEIDTPGDVDYYYTDFLEGEMLGGIINAGEYGSTLDPVLTLYEPDGVTPVRFDDDFDGLDPLIHHTDALGGGTYYWQVGGFGDYSTGDYRFTVDMRIYLTTKKNGTVDGIDYQKGDVLAYNYCADYWEMFLDASDLGIKKGINDVVVVPAVNGILMSMPTQNTGLGTVSGNDVYDLWVYNVGWNTAAVGLTTVLDGPDVGLSGSREEIDGVMVTPWNTLAISVNGNGNVPYTGDVADFADEDIVDLDYAVLGEDTSGEWYMLFDTSDTGAGPIDTHGIAMNSYWYDFYTIFDKVSDFGFGKTSIGTCWPYSLGWDTGCFWYLEAFHAPSAGMPANVNLRGLDFGADNYPDGFFINSAADGAQSAARGTDK